MIKKLCKYEFFQCFETFKPIHKSTGVNIIPPPGWTLMGGLNLNFIYVNNKLVNNKPRVILIILYILSLILSAFLLAWSLLLLWSLYLNPPDIHGSCTANTNSQTGLKGLQTYVVGGLCGALGEIAVGIVKGMGLLANTFASLSIILQLPLFIILILRNDLLAKYKFLKILIWLGLFLPYLVAFVLFLPDLIELLPFKIF